jgi:hypothetical protein
MNAHLIKRTATLLTIVPMFVGLSAVGARAQQAPAAATAHQPDALTSLNVASRSFYSQAKTAATARFGPVVIATGDNLVLRSGGQREEVRVIPPIYHHLKAIAHIPLALEVILAFRGTDEPFDAGFLDEIRAYRTLVAQAEKSLGDLPFNAEQLARNESIIAESLKLIDSILGGHRPTADERIVFSRGMNARILNNTAEATRAQLDGYHRQMTAWKAKMSASDWDRLTVVVMGMPLPRKNNTAVQYFAKLLGQPGESQRVVYSESVYDEAKALDLLATRAVDTQIGIDFFNEPLRMHRDLLGDAAGMYLALLFGRP